MIPWRENTWCRYRGRCGATRDAYAAGSENGGGGANTRGPQSTQSVPTEQSLNSEPDPPSSQSPSAACWHVLVQPIAWSAGGGGEGLIETVGRGGGGLVPPPGGRGGAELVPPLGGDGSTRTPQSLQSVPNAHKLYSAPAPPSSQSLSLRCLHVLVHGPGGEAGAGGGEGGAGGKVQSSCCVTISPVYRNLLMVLDGTPLRAFSVERHEINSDTC